MSGLHRDLRQTACRDRYRRVISGITRERRNA
jgi:hypothetical protein